MPKTRELSKAEKFYIENNIDKTDTQLASVMPGIGPKTVEKFRSELPPKTDTNTTTTVEETPEERVNRLVNGPRAGEAMGRHPQGGVVVMTETASEIVDAKKSAHSNQMTNEEYERSNRNRIHTIDPNKPTR
jgi:Holliday junction resolvasome RuvABC DNA-binding subunit